jgi:hypothetical protein
MLSATDHSRWQVHVELLLLDRAIVRNHRLMLAS